MKFQRIVSRVLPDGTSSLVCPFHVCSEGKENRVVCKDDEDLKVAFNFIPICARRSNVIVLMDCVLNSHMHSAILASNYRDAMNFGESYKKSYSKYFCAKYGGNPEVYIRTDTRPIPLEDDRHVRNTLCYIPRNSLDAGVSVDKYKWSSFGIMFSRGLDRTSFTEVSKLKYREKRLLLRTSDDFSNCNWLIDNEGIIIPESYCDREYAESAFFNDERFFLKVLGLTEDKQMELDLVLDYNRNRSVQEIIKVSQERSLRKYGLGFDLLTFKQKIPLINYLYYSFKVSPAQIARCLGIEKGKVLWVIEKQNTFYE